MAKKMTLEDLAAMTSRGFEDVERRLGERISQEVGSVKQELKTEIATVRTELKTEIADFRQENHDEHQQMNRKLDATIAVNDQLDRRVSRIEKHVELPPFEAVAPIKS